MKINSCLFLVFWNVAQIIKFIMNPSDQLETRVADVVKAISLKDGWKPVLGVHIRMGDACSDPKKHEKGRKCEGLDDYLPYVDAMVKKFGYNSVFLATDSQRVIEQVEQRKPFGLPWIYNKLINREKYTVFDKAGENDELSIEGVLFGNKKLRAAGFDPFEEMNDFLTDILLFAELTDGLVGKFTSNMDRIVASLLSTKESGNSCLKPVVSIDSPWCFDFMIRSGVSYDGSTYFC